MCNYSSFDGAKCSTSEAKGNHTSERSQISDSVFLMDINLMIVFVFNKSVLFVYLNWNRKQLSQFRRRNLLHDANNGNNIRLFEGVK